MTQAMHSYRDFEKRLIHMRWMHDGRECPAEEAVVEAMAEVWYCLSAAEQAQIRSEGPKTLLPEDLAGRSHHEWRERDSVSGVPPIHRELREVA